MGLAADSEFHVLAVDDSLIDRKLIERLLKISSYQVTTVDSGSKALEFLGLLENDHSNTNQFSVCPNSHQEVEVNLIITDYCMPGMTGYDLLKKIKESSSMRNIPVVIMSSENVPSRINRRYILLNLHQKKLEETISWCLTVTWKVSFHKILSSISLVSNIGKMSSGEVRKVSREDIQVVQNLIERCLQLYMNQKEVVNTLLVRAKIEPGFTELVWKKLEEENQEFFKAYYLRLIVKDQIMEFNRLLERQVELMRQICPAEVASLPMSNGSHIQQVQQDSTRYAPDLISGLTLKGQSMSQPIGSSLPHTYLQNAIDMSGHATSIDVLPNTVSNVGMMQAMNGGMVKPEAGYLGSSQYMFGNDGNVLVGPPANGNASVSSFGSVESHSQPFYESLLGANGAFGHLGPRNFSFSDLTVDMANYADILGNYSRSPFVAPDTNFFLDPHGRGQHQGANPPPC